ncbi:hypothetical protein [Streptomyces melanosporofaciens]|uniref:hypothetical protein n=1 Tax=Streptomyces melanosporofaciens TaxID=67327 RepID=UPI001FCC2605|nr:hypothetical protein [Streptomyces melanosporofaciens]
MRRRLQSLLPSQVSLRCDLARSPFGWPQSAVYFASVPAQHLEETSRVLSGFREVRACAIIASPHNLVIDVWLRGLSDVHAYEAHLSRRLPPLTIDDRSLVLRTVKHMGRLLDEDGRSVGIVPLLHPHGPGPSDTSLAAGLDVHTVWATVATVAMSAARPSRRRRSGDRGRDVPSVHVGSVDGEVFRCASR